VACVEIRDVLIHLISVQQIAPSTSYTTLPLEHVNAPILYNLGMEMVAVTKASFGTTQMLNARVAGMNTC